MSRLIRKVRLFPLAIVGLVALASFRVSADQQTGTWKIASPSDSQNPSTAADSATPNSVRRETGGLVSRGAAATFLPDGGILIAGGRSLEEATPRVMRLDVNAGTTLLAPLNIGRADHTATTLGDGRVLVTGGTASDGSTLSTAEVFDGDQWTVVPMAAARAHHTATLLKDGRVLVAGGDRLQGSTGSGAPRFAPNATIEIFDPATNQFAMVGVMSASRTRHAAALLPDGTVLIAGGETRNAVTGANEVLSSTEILDLATPSRRDGPAMDVARENFTATSLVNGDVLIAGGSDGTNDTASAERYVSAESRFAPVGWLQETRQGHVALRLPNNNGILIAGGSSSGHALLSAEMFMPASGMFVRTGNTLTSHEDAVLSRTAVAGTAVIMGGSDGTSTETYSFATVTTDRSDYAPGETVTITGTGWVPGELVTLELREDPFVDAHPLTPVYADVDGNIYSQQFAPDGDDIGITFYLTARGSVSEAQTTFTDASHIQSVTVLGTQTTNPVPSTGSTTYGTTATTSVRVVFNGNGSCAVSLSAVGLPSGATAAFAPSSVTGSDPNDQKFSLLTITTASTASGTTNFTVKATGTGVGDCATSDSLSSANVSFVVGGNVATTLGVAVPSPASVVYGTSGPVSLAATLNRTIGGAAVSSATIDFSVDGTSVGTAVTNGSGVATLSTYNPSALNAGSRNVQASFAGQTISGTTYTASTSGTQTLTVIPADQTITFGALSTKTFGDADFLVSATGGGSGNPVTFTASGDCTVATATVHIVAAGSCTITAHQAASSNYNAAPDVPQSFTIDQKTVTAVIAVNDKIYDANTTATLKAVGGRTLTGVLPADETTLDFSIATLTFDTANAGPSKTVTATGIALTGTSAPNYQLSSTTATTTAAISRTDASCTVTYYSVTYDTNAHTATGSCVGVETEPLAGLDLSATTHTNAGTYNGDAWTFTDVTGNYNNTNGVVNDAIARAASSTLVTFENSPYTYRGSAFTATANVTGIGGLDQSVNVSYTGDCTNVTSPNGCTASASFVGDQNHDGSNDSKSITITKASSSTVVTFEVGPYVFRGSAFTATANVTGVGGLDQSVNVSYTGDCTNVTVTNGCTATANFVGDQNHNGSDDSKSITITKADSATVVTFEAGPYVFRGSDFTATANVTGAGGLNHSVSVSYTGDCTNVTVTNGCTATANFGGDGNHNSSSDAKSITIIRAGSTTVVTCPPNVQVYSGNPIQPCTANATGNGGLNVAVTPVTYSDNTAVGTAHASATYAGDQNHDGSTGSGSFVINYNVCALYDQTKPNKKGSTIPLKIMLCDAAGNNVSSPAIVVQAVNLVKVSGEVPPFPAEDSGDANPDANFRYAGGFYIFNLSTKNGFSSGEWRLQLMVGGTLNGFVPSFFIK